MVVMLTTAGVTRATSVATSGVPARTGGVVNGAGTDGAAPLVAGSVACAMPPSSPTARERAAVRKRELVFRLAMASTFRVSAMFRAGNIYQWLDLSSR